MNEEDQKMIEADGWLVECESPFEISHTESESFASGYAAEMVVDSIRSYVASYGELPFSGEKYEKENKHG